jgi:hypothetical protein
MAKTEDTNKKNKHFILNEAKLKRVQRLLGTRTETETIERALDAVLAESERNRAAWAAQERFMRADIEIKDVFGRLEDH